MLTTNAKPSKKDFAENNVHAASWYARSLIEASLDPLVTISADGKITDVNEATEEVTGYSRSQLIGSDFSEYFTEPEKARAGYKKVFSEGFVRDYPLAIQHKSGRITYVLYNATLYRNEDGQVQGVFAAARDITDRKQAEEKYRLLFEKIDEGFCIVEMIFDSDQRPIDYRFLEVNAAFERQTGLHGARGKLMRTLAPDHEKHWFEIYGKVALTGEPVRFTNEAKALNRWYDVYAFPVGEARIRNVAILFNDITQSKLVEQKLLVASLYSRSLLEASLDPLVTISSHGKITDVNKATEEVTGCRRVELIGSDFSDYFTEPESAREGYKRVFSEGFVRDYPLAIRHKTGRITDVLYNATVYRNEAGEIQGVFAAARDVTERKRAEEKLRAASLYSRSLIEASLDPLVTISADGKITDVNNATELVTGCSRDLLIGSDFSDYFTEPDKARAGYKQVFTEGFVRDYPLAIRHARGKVTDVLYNATLFRNEAGEIQGVFAAARDITDRKQAEQKLLAASLYARSLLEASLDPLVTISAEGKITDVNNATEFATGLSREQLVGSDFSEYFTQPELARKGYQKVFTDGFVKDYPLALRHKSGRITEVVYNASLFRNEAGEIQGVFAAARDVTERNAMEKEIKQTMEKLRQSNAELEQFAYVASHDLQEPLRMVASYVQLLERRYKGKLDSDADEFIQYAVDGANRMRSLIDDLLTYSRVGRLGKPFEPTNIESTLGVVVNNLQASIRDTGAIITHDPLPTVDADGGQMVQLFQNLVGNGIKFHGNEPPRIHISARVQGQDYVFSVSDNGIGIDPQYFDRLFKIFQRLHTKQEYPGSGIGLVICKKIVERHGGKIWLDSQVGKGSTVYFTLKKTRSE